MATQVTGEVDSENLRSGLRSHADQICTAPDSRPATTMLTLTPSVADDSAKQVILQRPAAPSVALPARFPS